MKQNLADKIFDIITMLVVMMFVIVIPYTVMGWIVKAVG